MEFAEPQGVTFPMFAASLRAVLPQSEQRTLAEVLTRLQAGDEQVLPYALPELSAAAAERELGWRAHAQFPAQLGEICVQELAAWREARLRQQAAARRVRRKERLRSLVPWLENMAGALLVGALSGTVFAGERWPSFVLSYLYISAMGLLYGKRQSLSAVVLSLLVLITGELRRGADLVAMLYEPSLLLLMISYFFIGVLTGYFADRAAHAREAAWWQKQRRRNVMGS